MGKKVRYDLYDSALSAKENASRMGCSVATIRKFILSKEIDRSFDASYVRWKRINDFYKKHQGVSYSSASKQLGYSINTIKKYQNLTEDTVYQSKRDTNKVSSFDIRNINSIKSVSSSQDDILLWIQHLYNSNEPFDADLTASVMMFYQHRVPKPKYLYDKYPQLDEVKNLSEAETLPNESFNSIIYDLPFVISTGASNIIKKRFTHFSTVDELYQVNDEMMDRACRLLRHNGLLVIKTMDVNHGGKQEWVSDYVLARARSKELELLDKFILVAPFKLFNRTHSQHQARKYHSYFFVFRKH